VEEKKKPTTLSAWKDMSLSWQAPVVIFLLFLASAVIFHLACWAKHQAPLNVGIVALAMLSMLAISIWHSLLIKGAKATAAFFIICFMLSWFCEYIGHNRGWFFGNYRYTSTLGPAIGGVPVLITVTWSVIIYSAFMLIDWLVGMKGEVKARTWWGRSARSALSAAATATLVCAWDLVVDPVATSEAWWTAAGKDPWWYWLYGGPYLRELPGKPGLGAPGVPIGNFVGWWLAAFFVVFIFSLFFQRPNRLAGGPLDLLPLGVYFYLHFTVTLVALEMNWHVPGMNQVALIGTFTMMPVIAISLVKLAWDYT
jgi:putative membrane protein